MDHYFLGLGYYNKTGAEFLDKARSHFDRALELDPENVDALVRRAWVDLNFAAHYSPYLSDDRTARLRSAEADLGKAIKLRLDSAAAHVALGYLRMCTNRVVEGIAECERALAIDRNLASAHAFIGSAKNRAGRNEETEAHVLEALRISPRDTYAFSWMLIVGFAKLGAGRDEEAAIWLNRSIGLNPNHPTPHCLLAAALAHLGRMKEAREAAPGGLDSTRASQSRGTGPRRSATIPSISRAASAPPRACARPDYLRNERSPRRMRPEAAPCAALGTGLRA
jgi:tetratricopeptide (TPR) repeat protein